MADIDIKKLTIAELKKELTARGVTVPASALKANLQALLSDAMTKEKEGKKDPSTETAAAAPAPAPAVVESAAVSAPQTQSKPAAVAEPAKQTEPAASNSSNEETKTESTKSEPSDLEKKLLRAQKFGLPVKINDPDRVKQRKQKFKTFSEDEKKQQRAERFAKKHQVQMTVEDKAAVLDDKKKQDRAARFGIPVKESTGSVISTSKQEQDEFNERKRKRAERFGVPEPEDVKRQKRAERFSATETTDN